jgi:hypothetical protein
MDPFPDAGTYDRLASDRASDAYHHWSTEDSFFYNRLAGYVAPVGVLYRLFGSHLLLAQLLAALLGAAAASIICRVTLLVSDRRAALIAGAIVAFFPSHVLWSSVAYKDSPSGQRRLERLSWPRSGHEPADGDLRRWVPHWRCLYSC